MNSIHSRQIFALSANPYINSCIQSFNPLRSMGTQLALNKSTIMSLYFRKAAHYEAVSVHRSKEHNFENILRFWLLYLVRRCAPDDYFSELY